MPRQIPKPLYLQDQPVVAAPAATPVPAAAHANRQVTRDELLEAAAAAELALRAAHDSPEVTRVRAPSPAPEFAARTPEATPSRFARMGVIDETDAAPADLDEILARRRAVG